MNKVNKLDGFNILHQSASNVGSLILGLQSNDLNRVYDADVLYLLNADEINLKEKKNKFIIYQGSHGGENSVQADVILPSAAYSEKNGSFVNLEGRVQRSYKASYPPGYAKEDWEIFLEIARKNGVDLNFNTFEELREQMTKNFESLGKYDDLQKSDFKKIDILKHTRKDIKVKIDDIDFYQTNIVARSSKTMQECKSIKHQLKKTGTD